MFQVAYMLGEDIDTVSSWPKAKFERWVAFLRIYHTPKKKPGTR